MVVLGNLNIEVASWAWCLVKKEVTFSPNWFTSLGYDIPSELTQSIDTWKKLIHPDDNENVMELLNNHLTGKTPVYQCVNRLRMKSGEYRENLDIGIVIIRNKEGIPLRMTGVDIDLSQARVNKQDVMHNTKKYRLAKLTKREILISELFKNGLSDNEIAKKLKISPLTVKTHIKNICKKFETSGRLKLITTLYKNDLIEIDLPFPPNLEQNLSLQAAT